MRGTTHPQDPGEAYTNAPRVGIDDTEGELLQFLVEGKRVLEIGTGVGRSAEYMNKTAFCIDTVDTDPWVQREIFPGLRQYKRIRCHSVIPPEMKWDVVFIDGEHSDAALRRDIGDAERVCPIGLHIAHDAYQMRELLKYWTTIPTKWGLAIRYFGWEHHE